MNSSAIFFDKRDTQKKFATKTSTNSTLKHVVAKNSLVINEICIKYLAQARVTSLAFVACWQPRRWEQINHLLFSISLDWRNHWVMRFTILHTGLLNNVQPLNNMTTVHYFVIYARLMRLSRYQSYFCIAWHLSRFSKQGKSASQWMFKSVKRMCHKDVTKCIACTRIPKEKSIVCDRLFLLANISTW